MTSSPLRLLGISGSLRRESHCTAVLKTLADKLGDSASLTLFPLNDVPLYNQDEDGPTPLPTVAALREAIAAADGLVVITPEYNYGISGVLKNAIDWASRPYGKSALAGKPAVIGTVSPAFTGGARAQYQLREALIACGAAVVARPEVVIAASHEKIKDGRLVDEASIGFALAAVNDLLKEIKVAAFRASL